MTDDHLSERPVFFVIAKRFNNLVEGKHASYDWLQPIDGNCAVHRDELRPVARKNNTERSDRIVEQMMSILEALSDKRPIKLILPLSAVY